MPKYCRPGGRPRVGEMDGRLARSGTGTSRGNTGLSAYKARPNILRSLNLLGVLSSSTSFSSALWPASPPSTTPFPAPTPMESRKRPHADDGDLARPKKRAVSDDRASPSHLNGALSHSDEPKDGDNVEVAQLSSESVGMCDSNNACSCSGRRPYSGG